MTATFILSLDCEGKWGVADLLGSNHARQLTDDRLRKAYGEIVALLDEHEVPATFAFVGAFAQTPHVFSRIAPDIEEIAREYPEYLQPALSEISAGRTDGWHGDALVDLVGSARTKHEVALHGVTHVPWAALNARGVDRELALFDSLEGPVRSSRTFVFPRNMVAHSEALARHGFEGFRAARPERSRARSLLSEFNVLAAQEQPTGGGRIVTIPAGTFLNWRHGVRKLVPPAVTIMRARHLLDAAARNGGIVHYWLHPENVVSAPATLPLLRMLIREVARARAAGTCQVLTQLDYCRWQQSLR